MQFVETGLKKDCSYVPALVTMGDILMSSAQTDRAIESYSKALSIDQNHFEARLKRAKQFLELENHTLALADLEYAAKVYPYSGEVYQLRAVCYEVLGEHEKARQDSWKVRVFVHR